MAQRLVEKVDVGRTHQHAAERDTLPLTVGEFTREPLQQMVDAQRGGHLVDALGPLADEYLPVRPDFNGDARFSLTVFCG